MASSRFPLRRLFYVLPLALLAACTVRPLYGEVEPTGSAYGAGKDTVTAKSIVVAHGKTRVAQEVTNHLIFLLHGGQQQPTRSPYELEVNVKSKVTGAAPVHSGGSRLAGRTVVLTGGYNLTDTETANLLASGKVVKRASFGVGSQEFANLRAQRDAEDRAARELAEFIRLDVLAALNGNEKAERVVLEEDDEESSVLEPELPTIEDVE